MRVLEIVYDVEDVYRYSDGNLLSGTIDDIYNQFYKGDSRLVIHELNGQVVIINTDYLRRVVMKNVFADDEKEEVVFSD